MAYSGKEKMKASFRFEIPPSAHVEAVPAGGEVPDGAGEVDGLRPRTESKHPDHLAMGLHFEILATCRAYCIVWIDSEKGSHRTVWDLRVAHVPVFEDHSSK